MYKTKVVPALTSVYLDKVPMVTYSSLWTLYKPGTVVYVKQSAFWQRPNQREEDNPFIQTRRPRALLVPSRDDDYSACVVAQAAYGKRRNVFGLNDPSDALPQVELSLWSVGWTGTAFQRIAYEALDPKFERSRPVASLAVAPAEVYDKTDGGVLRKRLERRGHKYVNMLGDLAAHRSYKQKNAGYTGQITVDPEAYRQHVARQGDEYLAGGFPPQSQGLVPSLLEIDDGDDGNQFAGLVDVSLSEFNSFERCKELCILLPRRTEGFALKTKKWMIFEVDGISDEEPMRLDNQLDSELVMLKPDDKESLRTVLPRGQRVQSVATDFVEGKGEGKIFLLYGGPGTGETLTVECVANDTRRPLIRITAGDVGLSENVELQLRTWFMLAAKWHAILLIDEADVFLEHRTPGDLERDFLSTVFLRTMEYYEGVLFLTTNRAGHIDDSFISRITCPIEYPNLSDDMRVLIVQKFVKRFQETNTILIDNQAVSYLSKPEHCKSLNGRELRNVLQNAVAAAEYSMGKARGSRVEVGQNGPQRLVEVHTRHIQAAVKRQKQFQEYQDRLMGQPADKRAKAKRDWLDDKVGT
jgi:hypothetical protein